MATHDAAGRLLTAGLRDPDDPTTWLVRPWPVNATFCEVVRHFMTAFLHRLQTKPSTAALLAYYETYQTALQEASTAELTYPVAWQWRDEMLDCVGRCVAQFRAQSAERKPDPAPDRVRQVGRRGNDCAQPTAHGVAAVGAAR